MGKGGNPIFIGKEKEEEKSKNFYSFEESQTSEKKQVG